MALDRRSLIGLAAMAAASPGLAQPLPDPAEVIPLWPGRPPGARDPLPRENLTDRVVASGFQDRIVTGIGRPLMTIFRPANPNGAAALVIPGGGYIRVVIDKEGFEVGHRLAAAGVTAFVLRYRLPAEGWDHAADVPLQDAQQALRLIRAQGFKRVCAMGFSAGGHVAASLATHAEPPDLSALLYPVITMSPPYAHAGSRTALLGSPTPEIEAAYSPHLHVGAATPPTFLVHAWDDPAVPIENSLGYLAALRAQKVPAEAHLFEEGGHGFGIYLARGKPAAAWPDLFLAWAARRRFLG